MKIKLLKRKVKDKQDFYEILCQQGIMNNEEIAIGSEVSGPLKCMDGEIESVHCFVKRDGNNFWFTSVSKSFGCYKKIIFEKPYYTKGLGTEIIFGESFYVKCTFEDNDEARWQFSSFDENELKSKKEVRLHKAAGSIIKVGRGYGCDYSTEKSSVSRMQCCIIYVADKDLFIVQDSWPKEEVDNRISMSGATDLRPGQTTNGTWIRLTEKTEFCSLNDEIQIGYNTRVTFSIN